MKKMKVRVEFTEELLGTASNNKEIYKDFIASKAPDASTMEEEVAAVGIDGVAEKGMTVFPRTENGEPFIYDYQWRGYFKETCGFMRKIKGSKSEKLKAYKKEIDGLIFIEPRQCVINSNGEIGMCQSPLRAQTPQGERVSLSCSETLSAGSTCEFTVVCMVDSDMELVKEWLDYGKYHGAGQWRNSGKGKFTWTGEEIEDAE